jgi:hypothetical protein
VLEASITIFEQENESPSFIKNQLRKSAAGLKLAERFLQGAHHQSLYFSNGRL